jgi:hypothetical protein
MQDGLLMPLIGGLLEPFFGFIDIPRGTLALIEETPVQKLCAGISLLG